MPRTPKGDVYKLASHTAKNPAYGIRYRDASGVRRRQSPFRSQSAAEKWFRETILPQFSGEIVTTDITLAEFVPLYLERHASQVRPATLATLGDRLKHAHRAFGGVRLRELERMSSDIARWQTTLPERSSYGILQAFRQTLEAAVRWGYMTRNPAKLAGRNRQPSPRTVRPFTRAEVDRIAAALPPYYAPLPIFAAATGLRPEEWQALERRDVDPRAGFVTVARTVSGGVIVDLTKTSASRRQVPLSRRALAALDALPARLDSPLIFPAPQGGLLNLNNWRRREWAPAVKAAGVALPARIYDLRSTFASDALAAGVSVFELARVMGTSVRMIERHYGALLDGAAAGIAGRLDALDNERDRDRERPAGEQ